MAGRSPLTPKQLAKAAKVHAETGSYAAAAKAIGADPSAVRRRLVANGQPDRAASNAAACEAGAERARDRQEKVAGILERLLALEGTDGPGMEPRDIVACANALSRNAETTIAFCDRVDRRKNYRLTRTKTRAEIQTIHDRGPDGLAHLILPAVLVERHAEPDRPGSESLPPEPEAG